jgi:CheY-like chemotaxis protein
MFTDRQRLRQVLGNLVSNAVKFTSEGSVVLRVGLAGRRAPDGGEVLEFSVTDTGIGIAPENLHTIFGAFQQGDGTLSRRYGGTGLGLSIAREVGALLGGNIAADSEPGRGSTFTLYVPCSLPGVPEDADGAAGEIQGGANGHPQAAAHPGALDGASPDNARGSAQHRLLVLEGARGGLLTLLAYSAASDLADIHGPVRVETATSPEEAIQALRSGTHRCVVLDLGLPDASAFAFLEQLQDEPGLADLPVLAHTRDKLEGAQARLARLRFGDRALELLPSLDELRERMTLHLSAVQPEQVPLLVDEPAAVAAAAPEGAPPGDGHEALRGKKVLVIDDDARNVFAITSSLELHGMTVLRAPDGRQGISALLGTDDLDLILMDVMMPGMDGYATMAAIRQMPRFAGLPIIAVTARAMQGDREKSLSAGASDYVTKPVDTDELLTCMERWLARR